MANDMIKSSSHIGSTTYHNIETGRTWTVPWGAADWLLLPFLVVVLVSMAAIVGGFAALVWQLAF